MLFTVNNLQALKMSTSSNGASLGANFPSKNGNGTGNGSQMQPMELALPGNFYWFLKPRNSNSYEL